jgi:predicted AAA+ superfamily ATPase
VDRPAASAAPSPGEELAIPARASDETLRAMLELSGFPEPFLAASARAHRRWRKERLERFFREDVRDLEALRDLAPLELLADMIAQRVASPLSLNALREDLEASHRAVTHWVEVLDHLYHLFRIRPFAARTVRSLHKMPKAYLWDPSLVDGPGPRFENLVALHLLKLCHFLEDAEGHDARLCYLRDRTGREVDFLVTVSGAPWLAVEAKISAGQVDPALVYFKERLSIPFAYQVVLDGSRDFVEKGVRCLPASRFLRALV